jgi:putative ABC transport system permease protein
MELFAIALRNVFRNPRRTAINLVAIGLGVMIILTMKGWVTGFSTSAYQTTIDLDTAHVQVLQKDYEDEARRLPLDLRLKAWQDLKAAVAALPGVKGVGARLDFSASLSNGESALNVAVRGVDPEGEAATNSVAAQLKAGLYFQNENQVLIGSGLARKLKLKVGDQIFLTALDQYGVRNLVDGAVGGIFTSGYGIFDDGVVYTTLKKAQDTLALGPGDATRLVVRFTNSADLDGKVALVRKALADRGLATGVTVYPWQEFAKGLVDTLESRVRIMTFMMSILVLLVTVGILNSMSMAVQERYREIGTLRAIGMNRRNLTRMFLMEGFALGLAGGLAGLVGASLLAWLGLTFGIDARGFLPRDVPIPLETVMYPAYSPFDFPVAALAAALVATVGSIVPARRAGKMVVRDALGSHV